MRLVEQLSLFGEEHWVRGFKSYLMLKTTEHENSTAHIKQNFLALSPLLDVVLNLLINIKVFVSDFEHFTKIKNKYFNMYLFNFHRSFLHLLS